MLTRFRSSLGFRVAALFILAAILPILGAGLLTARLLEEGVRRDTSRRQGALAELGGALIRAGIARAREKMETVGRLLAKELVDGTGADGGAGAPAAVVDRLDRLVQPSDLFLELELYSAGTNPRLLAEAQDPAYNLAQGALPEGRAYQARQAMLNAAGPVVQKPLENLPFLATEPEANAGFQALPISVPVADGDRTLGALVGYLDFRRLREPLETIAQAGYQVRLVDAKGSVLASAGLRPGELQGQTRPVLHGEWTVEVSESADRVYEALAQVRRQALLWTGFAVLLAAGAGLAITARVVRPVNALTRAAQAMTDGDLRARSGLSGADEIGRLGAVFDRMAGAVERLDAAKGEFAANVSHELRTPLTGIRLSIANLLDGLSGPVDDRARRTLERLRSDADRLIRLVNDLLEVSRLEAGAATPRREPVDLAVLARECAAAIDPLAREKGIAVDIVGQGTMTADRSMMYRVLANLLDNAVKFTPAEGRVTVTLADGGFRVSDTGPGLGLDRPFEKFAQGRQDGVKNPGFGLGLAIAKKLVELHGGVIEVRSGTGGTEFVVKIGTFIGA